MRGSVLRQRVVLDRPIEWADRLDPLQRRHRYGDDPRFLDRVGRRHDSHSRRGDAIRIAGCCNHRDVESRERSWSRLGHAFDDGFAGIYDGELDARRTIGLNTLVALVGGSSVTVKAVGIAGPPAILQRVTADSLFTIDGATVLVTAEVRDAFGNPVQGATIDWSSSDGDLSATESKTGVSGHAENAFTSPSSPGESTVTASLAGKGSITFRIGHL